jgi:hypothetical protein
VEDVDGDAEARGLGDAGGQKCDRSADGVLLVAPGHPLATSGGLAVVRGELLVAPWAGELLVGGIEVEHRWAGA